MRYSKEVRAEGLVQDLDGIHQDAPFALYEVVRAT
jgi:hypothetical protein